MVIGNIVLKSMDEINELLVLDDSGEAEYEGKKQTDGILWEDSKLIDGHLLKAIEDDGGEQYDIVTTEDVVLSSLWVSHFIINGKKVLLSKIRTPSYIELSKTKYLDVAAKEVIGALPPCQECKAPLDHKDDILCPKCVIELSDKHAYSFKPEFKFLGKQIEADKDHPIHYGIELEYSLRSKKPMAVLKHQHKEEVYLVSDGSIYTGEGVNYAVELISQPHSFTKLMGEDSYLNKLGSLDTIDAGSDNGCHIHISRTAFIDSKHFGLFYFLVLENQGLAEFIANRKSTNYCQFNSQGTVATKENVAKSNYGRDAINERNDNTIEMRFFNSSSDTDTVKSYVQYVDSLIKYTRYAKRSVSLKGWKAYVKKYIKKYGQLFAKLDTYDGEMSTTIKYKKPNYSVIQVKNLKVSQFSSITSFMYNGVKMTVNGTEIKVTDGGKTIQLQTDQNGWSEYKIKKITEFTIIK